MKKYAGSFAIAVHPGEILQEMLDESGMTQAELARHLKMDPSKINEICRKKRGLSAKMAVLLGKAFQISPVTWLNLQKNWELSQVDQRLSDRIKPLSLGA
ncbi:MAG: HigA family addiction module antidote protein [Candidatus Hydrogenedentes bacterium]|nr:HigA family addiction module antidote protein [Candidatus Hydrogenedentota bacterium]